ncbi:MAG: DAK2 domain-containing protein [Actinomycetota bacterium]
MKRGKTELRVGTTVDASTPARGALEEALTKGASFGGAFRRSRAATEEGTKAAIPLVARKGRASTLGERSAGHHGTGATDAPLLETTADTWADGV